MSLKRILIASVAALSLGYGQQATAHSSRQAVALHNGQRAIQADIFGRYSGGLGQAFLRGSGCPPYLWGISRACARMVRSNRLRRAGVAGHRI